MLVEPLTRLLENNVSWDWTDEQSAAVQKIKTALSENRVLTIFDPNLPTELLTDASSVGIAAILMQNKDGNLKVIGYFSKQTTPGQILYYSYELETLAIVLLLQHFPVTIS